ncbi:MAG: LacI family DNA-binding transcriptional regulator [Eubacteriales bacterium]
MTNIKDVAKQCGVSIATVSRAFDKGSAINADTRERILKYCAEINFRPNIVARGLKRSKTQTVGIIIPSIDNYFYMGLLKYVEAELFRHGYRTLVSFIQHGVSEERDCLESMYDFHVEGLILSPRSRINEELLRDFSSSAAIMQLFTAPYEEYDSVIMDDEDGVKQAVLHLLDKGHRRILYLGGDPRVSGYFAAYGEYGLECDSSLVVREKNISPDAAAVLIKQKAPSAVLAVARNAESAWLGIKQLGLSIPGDISFIAYDDINWMKMLGVTAVSHPLEDIAGAVCRRLIVLLEARERQAAERVVLKSVLTHRESVGDIII